MSATFCLSTDTILRPVQGQWFIFSAASSNPLPLATVEQMTWVAQFASACDPETLIAALQPELRAPAQALIRQLQHIGVLVPAGNAPTITVQESNGRIPVLLQQIARMSYGLAADAQGLGEFAEVSLRESTGIGLEARLYAIGAAMHGLSQTLKSLRQPHLHQQAERLGIQGNEKDLRLHLGCGPVHLAGFINIDIAPAPLSMNVLWGLPFDDGQVAVVYMSHLLEHLFYPNDVDFVLREIYRVLKPGGTLRVVVPDIARCLRAYQEKDVAFFNARREHFAWWPSDASMLENFLTYAGVGTEPGFLFASHKYGYDYETLAKALRRCGYVAIEQSQFQNSRIAELRVEHLSEAASWQAGDEYLSLFVEAIRP